MSRTIRLLADRKAHLTEWSADLCYPKQINLGSFKFGVPWWFGKRKRRNVDNDATQKQAKFPTAIPFLGVLLVLHLLDSWVKAIYRLK